MFETLCQLLDARGPGAKAVVWAHNSHIGDASHTEMGQVREELNVGQLCRERFGREAVLIGFDTHMFETLCQILDAKGPDSKAVVWAHNSHIGDASHTEMGQVREELNIGQLCRERFGREAALIGFGTHRGTVAAATDWDGAMEVKEVRPSLDGSYERVCHEAGVARFLLDLHDAGEELRAELAEPQLERFIGVIYRPETERWSHYAQASLPGQFDGWVWFDESEAVTPLPAEQRKGEDGTYPFGL